MSDEFVKVPTDAPMWRASVANADATLERVAAYLPNNFRCHEVRDLAGTVELVVTGTDVAGWTMRDYVEPRLGSGGIVLADVRQEGRAS